MNIPEPVGSDEWRNLSRLIGLLGAGKLFLEITPTETVPETDTGGQVEYTKALERTMLRNSANCTRNFGISVTHLAQARMSGTGQGVATV